MLTILYFVFFWTSNASVNIHSSSLYSRLITFINHNHSELNSHKAKSVNKLHYTLYTVLLDDNFFLGRAMVLHDLEFWMPLSVQAFW